MTPILNTLNEYLSKHPVRMHVPFHNGITNNAIFPKGLYELDISEVSGYDIEGEDNPLFQSEKITANFFNMHHSFYLTGGASQGLLASMLALRKFGKKIILARNVHKSVINGLVLAGLEPVWLDVDFLSEWGIFSKVNPENIKKILNKNNDIAGCVIVSPTYEGVISDVKTIAEICHKKNIPLILDEAHGAHLNFIQPKLQLSNSADLIIQSWHKSLGALTQTGVLHLSNNVFFSYEDIKKCLDLVSSTSPSFLLLLSIELTRNHLEKNEEFFKQLFLNAKHFRENIKKYNHLDLFTNEDIFKIYLRPKYASGIDFAYELYKEHSIEIESANEIGFLMLVGISFNDFIMEKVFKALNLNYSKDKIKNLKITNPNKINQIINPREAFFEGLKNNNLNYECNINAPCPPGYATSIPGEKK